MMDVIGQRIDLAIGSVGSTRQYISDGQVIGVALSGKARNAALPQVPTFAEAGYPNYNVMYWFGVFGPGRMPPETRQAIQNSIMRAMNSSALKKAFENAGVAPAYSDSAEFGKRVRDEIATWSHVVDKAQITPQ
ncbi:putative exported protein [plant metagenome]|uniref:Putative exported protein n=1 Tax=plant metagenome TaxID=1297885 RepID=A0A484R7Z0_9ZZZZ